MATKTDEQVATPVAADIPNGVEAEPQEAALSPKAQAQLERWSKIDTNRYAELMLDQKLEFAQLLVRSGLLPADIKTREAALVIMEMGAALTIDPLRAFQSIYVVKGRPVLSSALIGGLLKRGGYDFEWTESTPEAATCVVTDPKGRTLTQRFTLEQAKKAGLVSSSTWQNYPEQMLRWRSLAFAGRSMAPDVLGGFYTDAEDIPAGDPVAVATATVVVEDSSNHRDHIEDAVIEAGFDRQTFADDAKAMVDGDYDEQTGEKVEPKGDDLFGGAVPGAPRNPGAFDTE